MKMEELIARAIFQDQFRLRRWSTAKPWLKQNSVIRARNAMTKAGVPNIDIEVEIKETDRSVNRRLGHG